MNYYPFHLGDYASHTAHLEPMEDLAYRRMLDLYYRTEKPLPKAEEVARLIRLREYVAEVERVLSEFFDLSPDGWRHSRCDEEIASFAAMVEGGRKGAAKRWGRLPDAQAIATPSPPQPNPNSNQNQNHNHKSTQKRTPPVDKFPEVSEQVWADWLALRKAKRAPVTQTVMDSTRREAEKAGMSIENFLRVWCRRGSQGLEAAWLKPDEQRAPAHPQSEEWKPPPPMTAAERSAADAARKAAFGAIKRAGA